RFSFKKGKARLKTKGHKSMSKWPLAARVGILGAGQLARMLVHAGESLGLEMHVLSSNPQDPAAQVTNHHQQGNPDNLEDLQKFLQSVDFITFESEFFNMDILENACSKLPAKPKIFPNPKLMKHLQDRRFQKELLVKFKIPTADFTIINTPSDLQ